MSEEELHVVHAGRDDVNREIWRADGEHKPLRVLDVRVVIGRTERDATKGIQSDARAMVRAYAARVLGWESFTLELERTNATEATYLVKREG